jgi:hypothetical protein
MFCDDLPICCRIVVDLVWLSMFDFKTGLVQNLPSICLLLLSKIHDGKGCSEL